MRPTITLNGTHPDTLMQETAETKDRLRDLLRDMYQPNGRDFPGQEQAFSEAQSVTREFALAANAYLALCEEVQEAADEYNESRKR